MTPVASLRATTALCAAILALFVGAAAAITHNFSGWTHESVRQAQARDGLLRAAPLALREPQGHWRWPEAPGAGRVTLVDFIYTRCPTVCRVLGSEFQQMQRQLAEQGDDSVRLLSLSFDLEHDDAAALAGYAREHGARPPSWRVAAPLDDAANRALLRSLGVIAIPDGLGGWIHNGDLHLFDADGRLRAIYDVTQWETALDHARHLGRGGKLQ